VIGGGAAGLSAALTLGRARRSVIVVDAGARWSQLKANLPTVAVHDLTIHPRENDLILATHGRSIWIFDDATVLQQMSQQILNSNAHLFSVRPALRYTSRFTRYGIGDKQFTGPNPPAGALITYYLKEKLDDKATLKVQIFDSNGKLVQATRAATIVNAIGSPAHRVMISSAASGSARSRSTPRRSTSRS